LEIPLAVDITSRKGDAFSDSYILNGYVQEQEGKRHVAKRPGLITKHQFTAGTGQGMFTMSGLSYCIINDVVYLVSSPFTSYAIPTVTISGQLYQFEANPPYIATPFVVMKTTSGMWKFNGTTITKVTTGTYPVTTVPGLAYLDGAYYVQTPDGHLVGSALTDPTTWPALNSIASNNAAGLTVATTKSPGYVVSLGESSTTFYWDASNPTPASPLSFAGNMTRNVGCADAGSVVAFGDTTFFMSKTLTGRAISIITQGQIVPISTAAIDSILNLDSLSSVFSFAMTITGRFFYLLSLGNTGISLVYNMTEKHWTFWASGVTLAPVSVSLTLAADLITVTGVLSSGVVVPGTFITIAGATNQVFNGSVLILTVSGLTFTYQLAYSVFLTDGSGNVLVTEAGDGLASVVVPTAGSVTGTTTAAISSFAPFDVMASTNDNLVLDSVDGRVYQLGVNNYKDSDGLIDFNIYTPMIESPESSARPRIASVEVRGDKALATAYIRYSDTNFQSWSTYRPVDLSNMRPRLTRQGSTRRRAYHLRCTADAPIRVSTLLISMEEMT
jgi:hypothetical protein